MIQDSPIEDARPRLLVCLDLQKANAPDPHGAAGREAQRRLVNCRRILEHARAADWNIVHVFRQDGADGSLSPPIEGLEPLPREPVMSREGVSAFASRFFRELVDGPHDAQIILIGFSLTSSCLATVFAAHDLGLATLLVEDAVCVTPPSSVDMESIEAAARAMAAPFTETVSTEQLIGRRPAPQLMVV